MASDDTFTAKVPQKIIEHDNFEKWEDKIDGSQLVRIEAAKVKIENEGLITNTKDLKKGFHEKKWKNGLRLYFAVVEDEGGRRTLLLLGSGKDKEQDKAIKKSRKVLEDYKVVKEDIKYNPNKR